MRYEAKRGARLVESDMTPMIDMTFQLIAFFMVVVNFSGADQNEKIRLPSSELAKPPDTPLETPITLQLTDAGSVFLGGEEVSISGLKPLLLRERQLLEARGDESARTATIVIRADREAKTGEVQKVMQVCLEIGFEKFALRAKHQKTTSG